MDGSLSTETAGFLDAAVNVARESGAALKELFHKTRKIYHKGAIDLVTDADLQAEEIIVSRLHLKYPEHSILTEEKESISGHAAYQWIIDPLDGTTNYAHRFPWFCVSIALNIDGQTVLGVVYHPILNQLFRAEKGKGAYLDDKPIRVSGNAKLENSLLATGFPYNIRSSPELVLSQFKGFLMQARGVRRAGSAVLDLCYVACGCFDGFWETNLKPWDTAAGALLVMEAGGRVTDFENRPFSPYKPQVLASNGHLHEEMLAVFSSQQAGS